MPWAVSGPTRIVGQACLLDSEAQARQRERSELASGRLERLLGLHDLPPQGGCALFQWLITSHADSLYEFMAHRGILLRLFTHNSSVRFGLPAEEADWLRLEQALAAYTKESL